MSLVIGCGVKCLLKYDQLQSRKKAAGMCMLEGAILVVPKVIEIHITRCISASDNVHDLVEFGTYKRPFSSDNWR